MRQGLEGEVIVLVTCRQGMCYETMCLCSGFYVKIMACLAALNDLWSVVKLHFINWLFLWLVAAKLPCCWGFFQGNLKSKSTYTDLTRADPSAVTEAVEPKQARMKGPQGSPPPFPASRHGLCAQTEK